jgi:2-polyprenyl-3-methyl-5-hydroxy-6-metoxy-1,4-benzoquinol methylase
VGANNISKVWDREREFFDRESSELDDRSLIIPEDVIDRYRRAHRKPSNFPKDTLFTMILPLEGKHVLDYGCGAGENACLLAACGATVTGFDLSPVSIEKARRRAELMGLSDRTRFDVYPAGHTEYQDQSFDIVIGFAVLHHLHMILDEVYVEINRLVKTGGQVYFIEPVANNHLLRKIRRKVPVELVATPDERQLEYRELERVRQYGFDVTFRHFRFMERLHRIIGDQRRQALRRMDYHIEKYFPFLRPMYGTLLVTAHKANELPHELQPFV